MNHPEVEEQIFEKVGGAWRSLAGSLNRLQPHFTKISLFLAAISISFVEKAIVLLTYSCHSHGVDS
jgi:hypothetical protein